MKKTLSLASFALLLAATVPAAAAPGGNAPNAADTDSGTYCIVRGGDSDPYQEDFACAWHTVEKYNKDGTLAFFRYQDKGTLQPGNVAPETGNQTPVTLTIKFGGVPVVCTGTEVTTPDGQYSSNLTCKG